jgi:hypothetical protein
MSKLAYTTPPLLYDALKKEGYNLPDECGDAELHMPVDGVFQLRFVVNVTRENLAKLGRALIRVSGE